MADQSGGLDWRGTVPVSTRFDDPYYSLDDGLSETRHVFLDGNGLPARFRDGFHVAELGFGTGLNLLALLHLWRATGQQGTLRFTTFEAYPLEATDMIRAQAAFPEVASLAQELAPHWQAGAHVFALHDLAFEMVAGDARETLPAWTGMADAWFLDGFSPAKNPELWSPDLLAQVAAHMAPGATVATYSAAGHVRRGLASAGLDVTRAPGYGRKRQMTVARKA
ncbi:tRNA (5-methylaminomethyl-2-thiouridine)(34)-methyltransferase MnmD [Thetidibacter halocola]|uniref:tRNA (5-methylaminomethyl-2-thiouridine)(34)-methyltransferase MnmD n=1 Tax=Thetidibacter halocola TaxID=2827239 RepID=A0A8J7WG74_9RHOB|nr:tRNA (5-methylaminomethyl-2-thiouridine)(34)-methyltransferase MnmD [Thetidibacter halocola]MBS0126207.1 tRNA (5-methylaminomethyl-2-thiouridine)(34)-methyltransferase MnmD [Thetidibacter halocola]